MKGFKIVFKCFSDVSPNVNNSQTNMPVVDLRLVKQEKFDDDEIQMEQMVLQRNWSAAGQEIQRKSRSALLISGKDSNDVVREEHGDDQSQPKETQPFSYRVPIVYPIQSPPIDYQSISRDHSPNTKDYRLERERSESPKQLYEETPTESPGGNDTGLEDNSNITYSTRYSPSQKISPYSLSPRSESKDDSRTSPKATNPSNSSRLVQNTDEKGTATKRRRNMEGFIPLDGEKEEESLWKQVQRYRHRKRLPLGKLMATQEETIFMQYNELRERRHREGRVATTRHARPQSNDLAVEPAHSPPESYPEIEAKGDAEPRLPGSLSPQLSPSSEKIPERVPSYVMSRQRLVDLPPKGKSVTYVYVTGPGSIPTNLSNPEVHPVIYDSNTECRNVEQSDNQPNRNNQGYHGYMSQEPARCHGYEPRGVEARGRTAVRPGAMECRGFVPYDDCYHDNYHNHRPYCSTSRYHSNESCHGNRKRRVHGWDHYCCRRKRARPTSSEDDDDEYAADNDIPRWYSKERLQRLDTRDNEDVYLHDTQNGGRQCSPSSADSRDNESVENGPTQAQFPLENGENGQLSKESSPVRKEEEDSNVVHSSPSSFTPHGEPTRQQDDDVVCQVNGLFSLPGYRETKYDITKGELMRRTGLPETLTRVEMISYVRQAKTSGRILLDTNGITTSNRSHPTILSRVCEREAQVLACGIHKMNLEYLPIKRLVQTCVDMYKSRGCDGCQDCRLKLRRRLVDVEITRYNIHSQPPPHPHSRCKHF